MKTIKYLSLLLFALTVLAACDSLNEVPVFDDNEAFVAFRSSTMSVKENDAELKIPVLLTSLSGISATVEFSIKDSTAVRGEHFELVNESSTLTFTKDQPIQDIIIKPIDNDVFTGDIVFTISLTSTGGVNMGQMKTVLVRITDDEHPLVFIFGTFTAVGSSYFDGPTQWGVEIEKDADDVNTVWITNLVPGGSSEKVYGTVNADKTELRIPIKQVIATSGSYPKILLEGFYGPDGNEQIASGGFISADIDDDGTITINDFFGSRAYSDDAATVGVGYFNLMEPPAVLTKN